MLRSSVATALVMAAVVLAALLLVVGPVLATPHAEDGFVEVGGDAVDGADLDESSDVEVTADLSAAERDALSDAFEDAAESDAEDEGEADGEEEGEGESESESDANTDAEAEEAGAQSGSRHSDGNAADQHTANNNNQQYHSPAPHDEGPTVTMTYCAACGLFDRTTHAPHTQLLTISERHGTCLTAVLHFAGCCVCGQT
jgi:hypothetical protein